MSWDLTERTTHHNEKGKFCSAGVAVTVTKNGERYKVVRQHRKMKPAKEKNRRVQVSVESARARSRKRGLVRLSEVLNGV